MSAHSSSGARRGADPPAHPEHRLRGLGFPGRAREPEPEQALLYGAVIREAQAISRNDKIEFVLAARYNGVNFSRLLAD